MTCPEIKLNLEAYALGALDPPQRAEIDQHLLECDACRRAALQYAIVAHTLPDALAKRSTFIPPAALKQNLLRAAAADQRARADKPARSARPSNMPSPRAARGIRVLKPRALPFALAGAAFVIAILLTGLVVTRLQMQQALSDVQTLRAQTPQDTTQASNGYGPAPAQEIFMRSPDPTSNAYAIVTTDPVRKMFVVRAVGLPTLSDDEHYVIWATTGGVTQAVGGFKPLSDGSAHISFLPMQNWSNPNTNGTTDVAYLAAQNPPILKRVLITRQFINNPLMSNDPVLVWRANPNEGGEEFDYLLPVLPLLRGKYEHATPREIICDLLPLDDPRCNKD